MRAEATLVGKMNSALVGVLRHDWPAQWPSFIPDIVAASK
jgi:exportin-1